MEGPFQTRSVDGALCYHDTLRKAVDYANNLNDGKNEYDDEIIWKISFSIGSERVRLVWSTFAKQWLLRQMDEELDRTQEGK